MQMPPTENVLCVPSWIEPTMVPPAAILALTPETAVAPATTDRSLAPVCNGAPAVVPLYHWVMKWPGLKHPLNSTL